MQTSVVSAVGIGLALALTWLPCALAAEPQAQGEGPPRRGLTPDEQVLVRANNQFTLELLVKLPEEESNTLFSPFSVSAALSMTAAGARGDTADQIAAVLHVRDLGPRVHPAFAALLRDLDARTRRGGDQLEVANALWAQAGVHFLPEFRSLLERDYGAGLLAVNFTEVEGARRAINQWVGEKTRHKIPELIPPGGLDPRTPLLLTDVIYFKGRWKIPFSKDRTKNEEFHPLHGTGFPVPFMHQEANFFYMEDNLVQVLEIPYTDGVLVMDILLPKKRDGLPELEGRLSEEGLGARLSRLRPRKVEVSFPRVRFAKSLELRAALSELGMSRIFGGAADFSGMVSGGQGLALAAMVHKACIDINEEGTEATAVTAPPFTITSIQRQGPAVFRADHPCLFLIRDKNSGCLYFIGRIMRPES